MGIHVVVDNLKHLKVYECPVCGEKYEGEDGKAAVIFCEKLDNGADPFKLAEGP